MEWYVLLIEDDITVSLLVSELLKLHGIRTIVLHTARETVHLLESGQRIGAVLVDLELPDANGLDVIRRIRHAVPGVPFFIVTADSTVESAVTAMKAGALGYFTKPFDPKQLVNEITTAKEMFLASQESAGRNTDHESIIRRWRSSKMREALETATRAARTLSPVLITGPANTGKNEIAKTIHQLGPYKHKPFLVYDAALMNPDDLERQLFGQSFTQSGFAFNSMKGHFGSGHATTIHLRNFERLGPEAQGKLSKWLHARNNGDVDHPIDCRLIASSTRNPPELISEGLLREDLRYAVAIHHIEVPSLAERHEDLPLLCEDTITKLCVRLKLARPTLTRTALEEILDHPWPGNLSELETVLTQAVTSTRGQYINKEDLPRLHAGSGVTASVTSPGTTSLEELSKATLIATLEACGGNRRRAATRLQISLRTIYNMINRHGLRNALEDTTPPSSDS